VYLFKYLGLDGIHPGVPKELADVIVRPLCMKKRTWSG